MFGSKGWTEGGENSGTVLMLTLSGVIARGISWRSSFLPLVFCSFC